MKWYMWKVCKLSALVCSRKSTLAAMATLTMVMGCLPLFSQVDTGAITGGVYDQSGGAIVGARVTVTDVARGIMRTLTTTSTGQYVASNELPGTYTVAATANGFETQQQTNVQVEVGQTIRVDLKLQPGAQAQTVTITSAVPQINTTDATLGGTVSNTAINNLPLSGRNYLRLLSLRPGATQQIGSGEGDGSANMPSYNGLRSSANIFLVEGLVQFSADGQPTINQAVGSGDSGSVLSIDAIQEMDVEVNPKAEYGWKDGAAISVGIKSGTNSLHGTAFAFGRDGAWDAGDYFGGRIPLEQEQFGMTLGGPIIKNKLFWFTDYEGVRFTVGSAATPSIPSDVLLSDTQDPSNNLSMVNACNAVGRENVNPLSAQLAGLPEGSCVPLPATSTFENVFPFNSGTDIHVNPNLNTTSSVNGGLGKIDYQISDKNHVSGTVYISKQDQSQYPSNIVAPQWGTSYPVTARMYNGSWTYIPNSSWVNELRGGYAYTDIYRYPLDVNRVAGDPWPQGYGINTGVTEPLYGGFPTITIGGFSGILGSGSGDTLRGPEANLNIVDHVSYARGNHSFKFGGEYLFTITDRNNYRGAEGTVAFTTLQDFLSGNPKNGKIFRGNAEFFGRSYSYALFAQDDWRIKPRLTLNLGLRYEYYSPITDKYNNLGNFNPNVNPATTSALVQAGGPFPPMYRTDRTNFSPRFGMAWDIRGNGKTVLRAGASIMYYMVLSGEMFGSTPFGANIPSIGVNNSGTGINDARSLSEI